MDIYKENLKRQLIKCRDLIKKGYTNIRNTRLPWLNAFCLEFYEFSQDLHKFLLQLNGQQNTEGKDYVEIIYLCLTQIVTCIKHMEKTIKAEEELGAAIWAARQHFLDRILWCLERLRSSLKPLTIPNDRKKTQTTEERSFVELMDRVLDLLSLYSNYNEESPLKIMQESINVAEDHVQASLDSQEIRSLVDLVLGHTLAFANVALQQDKKAISALCQKVLRECIFFHEECSTADGLPDAVFNYSNRKLRATSLENALHRLEDFITEALLRLVFTCLLDVKKISIEKLRQVIRERGADDPELDELIADFDVNVDRITQIGIFAISFAPNVKIKTTVRSCLASLESLDSCIIPSLQTRGTSDVFAKLLEQHFNEEVSIFKNSIQEIIDSHAFASCFFEFLTQTINLNVKAYNKESLKDLIQMAEFLYEHFQLPVNYKQLKFNTQANRMKLLEKFDLILQECKAVLEFNAVQLEPQRVLKRFKILRSILRKLINEIGDETATADQESEMFLMAEELSDVQQTFSSMGISPSIRSILYKNRKQRLSSDSLKANYSKISTTTAVSSSKDKNIAMAKLTVPHKQLHHMDTAGNLSPIQKQRSSLRRRESLRTTLFKRQKICESEQIFNTYKYNSDSLQISEILNQLTSLSSNLSKNTLEEKYSF